MSSLPVTYQMVRESAEINTYIQQADASLIALGFTEHSFAHVTRCAAVASHLLEELGADERTVELARIAAYMHDIGNLVNRVDHAQSGAVMAFRILDKMGMPPADTRRAPQPRPQPGHHPLRHPRPGELGGGTSRPGPGQGAKDPDPAHPAGHRRLPGDGLF